MLKATEDDILMLFERVHGKLGRLYPEVIYGEDDDIIAVACMKHGKECWRATLTDLLVDLKVIQMHKEVEEKVHG